MIQGFQGNLHFRCLTTAGLRSVSERWVLKEKKSSYCSSARAGKTTTALFTRRLQFTSWQTFHFQFPTNCKTLRRKRKKNPYNQMLFSNWTPLSKTPIESDRPPRLFGLFLVLNRARLQRVSIQPH